MQHRLGQFVSAVSLVIILSVAAEFTSPYLFRLFFFFLFCFLTLYILLSLLFVVFINHIIGVFMRSLLLSSLLASPKPWTNHSPSCSI